MNTDHLTTDILLTEQNNNVLCGYMFDWVNKNTDHIMLHKTKHGQRPITPTEKYQMITVM